MSLLVKPLLAIQPSQSIPRIAGEPKTEALEPAFLKRNHLPVADAYFEDADGQYVSRTMFEYIRDHLGYRLELQDSSHPTNAIAGDGFKTTAKVINCGFAAPVNPRPVYLVLVDQDNLHTIAEAKTDVRTWYPCDPDRRNILGPPYALHFGTRSFPKVSPGRYKLGIWMPDNRRSLQNDARYAIRVANREVPWWTGSTNHYGVNVVGEVTVR